MFFELREPSEGHSKSSCKYSMMDDLLFSILTSWIDGGELQTSNLQWVLTAVPVLKSLVLGLSFIFWYVSWSLQSLKVLLHRAFLFLFSCFCGSTRSYCEHGYKNVPFEFLPLFGGRWWGYFLLLLTIFSHYFDRKGQGVRRQRVGSMQVSWVLRV